MAAARIAYLFDCFVRQTCTAQEREELMVLLARPEHEAAFLQLIQSAMAAQGPEKALPEGKARAILSGILQAGPAQPPPPEKRHTALAPRLRAAAVVVLVVLAGVLYRQQANDGGKARRVTVAGTPAPQPVRPGTDKALLTLADGTTVLLDSLHNASFAQPGNASIKKEGTLLVYHPAASANNQPVAYNTLATPRGGQYRVLLSDGTQVWLNAASSLRYPTRFAGAVRAVTLTGEAYFEVARNPAMPFQVTAGSTRVEVLGTHFNINAYTEEQAVRTSLLEGSVQVTHGTRSNRIRPGEQAVVAGEAGGIQTKAVDMDAVVAWKNGLFEFEGADVAAIMRQIERWYDVEVRYKGAVPKRRFVGKISREAQLAEVLQILALSNIRFSVQGKRIIVH